ncbi:MAG: PAS domain S-box protein [Chloroflexota bacterium]
MKNTLLLNFRIRSYTFLGLTAWAILILGLSGVDWIRENNHILEIARNEARAGIEKDLLYRRWNTSHGGVYVPVTETPQPNPYLIVPEREITSPSGQLLTLINPAYMTRQVFEVQEAGGTRAHLTSLKPLNPQNEPDPWEEAVLVAFEHDVMEVNSVETLDGKEFMRLMQPFIVEEGCLKCHASQGYQVGDIRGGISVSIPISKYAALKTSSLKNIVLIHGIIWIVGTISIYSAAGLIKKRINERAEMLWAVQTSEARYRSLFEQSHDAVFILDSEGRIMSTNQRAAEILGYTLEELQALSVSDISYEAEASEQVREKLLSGEHVPFYERRFRRKDGGIVSTEVNVELVRDVQGNPLHFQSAVRDITERKQAEISLRESEARYRSLFEQYHDAVFILDMEGRHLAANQRAADMLGYSIEEIQTLSVRDTSYEPEASGQVLEKLLRGERVPLYERKFKRKDGEIVMAEVNVELVRDDQGNPLHILSVVRDITGRKRAEEAIRASNETLSAIIGVSPLAVMLLNMEGMIQLWNPAAERIFGWTKDEVLGRPNPIIPPDKVDEYHRLVDHIRLGGTIAEREVVRQRKDGSRITISLSSAPLFDADGHPRAIMATVADITERKRAEGILQARLRLMEFAATHSLSDLLQKTLDEAEDLTGSTIGFYHFLQPDQVTVSLQAWSTRTKTQFCTAKGEGMHYNVDQAGIWVDCIHTGKPVIHNDYASLPHRKGLPEGHAELRRELVVPVKRGEAIVSILGVGNKPQEYTDEDIHAVSLLADLAWDIAERKQVEESIRVKTEELEVLFSISTHLRTAQTADEMLPLVLNELRRVLVTDASAVILHSVNHESFTYALGDGLLASNIGKHFSIENSISGLVMKTRQPYVTSDLSTDTRKAAAINGADDLGPAVLVPIQSDAEFLGILVCAREKDRGAAPFSSSETQLLTAIGEMVGNALRRARLYDQALSRLQHVQALHSVDMAISANFDLNITLEILLNQVTAQLNVHAADILLLDPYSYVLEFAAGHGFQGKQIQSTSLRIGEGLAGLVALERRMLVVPNLAQSERLVRRSILDEGLAYYYGVPLISKGNLLGVLEVFSRSPHPINTEQLDYLEALAIQAAIAIDNAKLFGQLQSSNLELMMAYDATIEGWSRALELRDEETEGHTLRVTEMTMKLAKVMGISEKEFTHIRRGALMHDIGKMGIPDKILLKPGTLDEAEWEIMKLHPVYAYEMLQPITFLRPAVDIPFCHHEKWDGSGYPRRLKGEAIPLAARIFAIADVYDALTSDRPYRKAWPKEKAVAYIIEQSGKHFQPEVVEAFVRLVTK